MVASMRKRIEAGVKWLDTQFEREDWLDKLDVVNLSLGNTDTCVCGQIFGEYMSDMFGYKKGGEEIQGHTLGFDVNSEETDIDYSYDLLTYLWAKKVVALKFKNGFSE